VRNSTKYLSNIEPRLSIWLEQERANLVQFIAKERIIGLKELYSLKHFYQMKFLLKSTAYMLSECIRSPSSLEKDQITYDPFPLLFRKGPDYI
jgi:hypothetical protein